jgi:hypothetical protein
VRVTNDSFYDGPPAINCMGQVVWSKRINNEFDREEIFLYDIDGTVRQITDDNVRDAFPDINDDGVIVWSRQVGPGGTFEVAKYEDGEITILTNDEYSDFAPRINNLGHIVWNKIWYRGCSEVESDIFFYDGERTTRITSNGFSNQGESINDVDEMVWTRYDFCQNPWRGTAMHRKSNGDLIELTDGSDQTQSVFLNNRSEITWEIGAGGIIHYKGGRSVQITDWGYPTEIADNGDIVILRWHDDEEIMQVWLYRSEKFIRLTDDGIWNGGRAINSWGEMPWVHGGYPATDIVLMSWRHNNGDLDRNDVVDIQDHRTLGACVSGPGARYAECACRRPDMDRDGDVDLRDFAYLQQAFGGGS